MIGRNRKVAGLLVAGTLSVVLPIWHHPAAAGGSPPSGDAVGTPAIMAVPGSRAATYGTPIAVVEPGDDLTFVNLELFPHDVRSVATGPDDTPWCNPPNPNEPRHRIRNPRQFPIGKCPLLWSPAISVTVGAVETKVFGTKNLKSGKTIKFYCTVFPNMQGTLIVP